MVGMNQRDLKGLAATAVLLHVITVSAGCASRNYRVVKAETRLSQALYADTSGAVVTYDGRDSIEVIADGKPPRAFKIPATASTWPSVDCSTSRYSLLYQDAVPAVTAQRRLQVPESTLYEMNLKDGKIEQLPFDRLHPREFAYSPDGQTVAVVSHAMGSPDYSLYLLGLKLGRAKLAYKSVGAVFGVLSWNSDGKSLNCYEQHPDRIDVLTVSALPNSTPSVMAKIPRRGSEGISGLPCVIEGVGVVYVNKSGDVVVDGQDKPKQTLAHIDQPGNIYRIAASPSGRYLAVEHDYAILVIEVRTGRTAEIRGTANGEEEQDVQLFDWHPKRDLLLCGLGNGDLVELREYDARKQLREASGASRSER